MKSPSVTATLMVGLLLLDQVSKFLVRAFIPLHHSSPLIPYLIYLTHVENRGVSFSFLGDISDGVRVPLLVGISLVAVGLLAFYWLRHRREFNTWTDLAFVLILPGALGNLIDRVAFGTVTDFFHFRLFDYSLFVNNIADIQISLGVLAYVAGSMLPRREKAPLPGPPS